MATRCTTVSVSPDAEPPADGDGRRIPRSVKVIGGMTVGGVVGAAVGVL